jgi:signal transduction histidine kinase
VRVASPRSELEQRVLLSWLGMLALALFAVGLSALLARVLAGRLSGPLEQLSAAAVELGGGNFAVRTVPSGIGEIDRAGASMNRTAGRLGELVGRERAFSAHASHQLRTPLTALRLGLDTAMDASPEALRDAAREAIAAVDGLERIIEDVLLLARTPSCSPGVLPLSELLRDVRLRWNPVLAAAGRQLDVEMFDAPQSRASVHAVRQVLDVLLDNAYRHGAGEVTVRARESTGALAVDVGDHGPGLGCLADAATGQGMGLGLARRLVEAQDGRLLLPGPGPDPVFTVLLPPVQRAGSGEGADRQDGEDDDPQRHAVRHEPADAVVGDEPQQPGDRGVGDDEGHHRSHDGGRDAHAAAEGLLQFEQSGRGERRDGQEEGQAGGGDPVQPPQQARADRRAGA